MENEQYKKSYRKEPTFHKVHVFHLDTSYRFFHISCEECKLQHRCSATQHKREICSVAKNTEKLLLPLTCGHVYSFVSDEFYILPKTRYPQELKEIFKFLRMKYMKKKYVRE